MNKQSYNADAMQDAMEIACQVWKLYGEDDIVAKPGLPRMVEQRRMPYDHPVFQAAYAALCLERGLSNQYMAVEV